MIDNNYTSIQKYIIIYSNQPIYKRNGAVLYVLQMESYKIEFFYMCMFYGWTPSAYIRCTTDEVLRN